MERRFNCEKCGNSEAASKQVRIIIESDIPDTKDTKVVLCYRCGMEATLMIGTEWINDITRQYLDELKQWVKA